MGEPTKRPPRRLRLFTAMSIGVGAIVGGAIHALAGTASIATGPGVWLAFLLNGVIAIATSLSFAELSAAFPQSDSVCDCKAFYCNALRISTQVALP